MLGPCLFLVPEVYAARLPQSGKPPIDVQRPQQTPGRLRVWILPKTKQQLRKLLEDDQAHNFYHHRLPNIEPVDQSITLCLALVPFPLISPFFWHHYFAESWTVFISPMIPLNSLFFLFSPHPSIHPSSSPF
ncbi:hypothetical protein CLAIMM_07665, partial [Cladophialophora immunda]